MRGTKNALRVADRHGVKQQDAYHPNNSESENPCAEMVLTFKVQDNACCSKIGYNVNVV